MILSSHNSAQLQQIDSGYFPIIFLLGLQNKQNYGRVGRYDTGKTLLSLKSEIKRVFHCVDIYFIVEVSKASSKVKLSISFKDISVILHYGRGAGGAGRIPTDSHYPEARPFAYPEK